MPKYSRRRYKFNYGDVGELVGVKAQAVRVWFGKNGGGLKQHEYVENLRKVIGFVRKREGCGSEPTDRKVVEYAKSS